MKKILSVLFLFALVACSFKASAQFSSLKDVNVFVSLPSGFTSEIGKAPSDSSKFGYFYGISVEAGDRVSSGFDFSVYAKGALAVHKYVQVTAQLGVVDIINLQAGLGLRGIIPTKIATFVVEPVWRTGHSILNAGVHLKL